MHRVQYSSLGHVGESWKTLPWLCEYPSGTTELLHSPNDSCRTIQDPASQRLTWYKPPLTVLVIKKVRDAMVIPPFIALCKWFINQKRMVVFVESAIMGDPVLTRNPEFGHIQEKSMTFNETKDELTDKIDFGVCLGGDGTLLYASSLFQQSVSVILDNVIVLYHFNLCIKSLRCHLSWPSILAASASSPLSNLKILKLR